MSMDERIRSDDQSFISPIVHLSTFLKCAQEEYSSTNNRMGVGDIHEPDKSTLSSFLICSERTTNKILDDISLDHLVNGSTRIANDDFESINQTENIRPENLRTHKYVIDRLNSMPTPSIKTRFTTSLKYYKWTNYGNELTQFNNTTTRYPPEDIVLMVNIGRARNRMQNETDFRDGRRLLPTLKLMCRGDTTLLQLRERIVCASDFGAYIEEGKELEKPSTEHFNITLYPSSFIFIHDTFYIDTTRPECIDISKEIRQFMEAKPCFGETFVRSMDNIKIIDLTLRLGQPYLFLHSGNCEHLLTFSDLRILTKDDEQDLNKYPIQTFERGGVLMCVACKNMEASMGVENANRLPLTPAFFCDECFKEFNYSHGQRLGEFRAYPYFQANRL